MRYRALNVFDRKRVVGTLVTDDDGVVTEFEPEDGIKEDLFRYEIERGETIQRVAGHWRLTAFMDEDGKQVSGIRPPDEEGDEEEPESEEEPGSEEEGEEDVGKSEEDTEVELTGTGVVSKADEERRIVYGWAYVTHDRAGNVVVDKSGDFVDTIEEIDKAAVQFMLDSRNTDAHHTNVKSGTVVESMVFTPEKVEKMGLPPGVLPSGWWIGTKVDEPTWQAYKQGHLTAFSVHGRGVRKAVH